MIETYLGMIAYFGFNFVPYGWMRCEGQILQIAQNSALYSLLGMQYGGDGRYNFGLPDLRGRVVVGSGPLDGIGTNYTQATKAGNETTNALINHSHSATLTNASATIKANTAAGLSASPANRNFTLGAATNSTMLYNGAAADVALNVGGGAVTGSVNVAQAGNTNSVSLMQPYLVLNVCIAISGIYPTRD
jgi:microcystin-dependent protein